MEYGDRPVTAVGLQVGGGTFDVTAFEVTSHVPRPTSHRYPCRPIASRTRPIAVSIALALFSVSAHSSSGTESRTIPAPAWTFATPPATTQVRIVIARSMRAPPVAM